MGQDGDNRFPGVFPAPGSKPSALPAGPHSTPPPNCSWVAGHASKHLIATRRPRAGKTSGRAPGDGQSSPHPGLDRSPQLTTCSTEAPFRRMMASVKSGLSAQTGGAGREVSRVRAHCHTAPLRRKRRPFQSPALACASPTPGHTLAKSPEQTSTALTQHRKSNYTPVQGATSCKPISHKSPGRGDPQENPGWTSSGRAASPPSADTAKVDANCPSSAARPWDVRRKHRGWDVGEAPVCPVP